LLGTVGLDRAELDLLIDLDPTASCHRQLIDHAPRLASRTRN
jgi:hypothetical protein